VQPFPHPLGRLNAGAVSHHLGIAEDSLQRWGVNDVKMPQNQPFGFGNDHLHLVIPTLRQYIAPLSPERDPLINRTEVLSE